jgi:uncharacterized membrane protein YhaH (DUF805 family)
MNTDPYAPPAADLDSQSYPVATSLWRARGRLGMLAFWAQIGLLTFFGGLVIGGVGVYAYAMTGSFDLLQKGNLTDAVPADTVALASTASVLVLPILLVLAYISICMIIKRLHDLGLRGWWSLLLLVPLLNLLFLLYVFVWPGKGDNSFGAPRPARGWEKLLGGLFLLLAFISAAAGMYLSGGESLMSPADELSTRASAIAATLSQHVT